MRPPSFRQANTPSPLFLAALEEQRRQEALRSRSSILPPPPPSSQPPRSPRGYYFDPVRNRHFRTQRGGEAGGAGGGGDAGAGPISSDNLSTISEMRLPSTIGISNVLRDRECTGNVTMSSSLLPPPIRAVELRALRTLYRGQRGSSISSLAVSSFALQFSKTVSSPLVALSTDANNIYIGALDKGVTMWLPPFCIGRGNSAVKALTFAPSPCNIRSEPGWPQSIASILAVASLGHGEEPGAVYIFAAHQSVEKLAKYDVTRGSAGGRSTVGGSLWSSCWLDYSSRGGGGGGGGGSGGGRGSEGESESEEATDTILSSSSSPGSLSDVRLAIGASAGEDSAILRLRPDGTCIADNKCVFTSDAFCCASDKTHEQVIFGTRSGSVVSWDLRAPSHEARRVTQLSSSALSLNPLLDDEGLWLLGDAGIHLELRDPRAWSRGAVTSIPGYDNTIVKHALGVATCSPSNGEKRSTIAVCSRGNVLRLWNSRAQLLQEVTAHDTSTDILWNPTVAAFAPPQFDVQSRGEGWGRNRCIVASQTELIEIKQQRGRR